MAATKGRELKLGIWPGFALPDLNGGLDGAASARVEDRRLESVYFDTQDLRLLRRGIAVRYHRDESSGEAWTVRLPDGVPAVDGAAREISVPGGPGIVPELLADVVRGWALGAPLAPVARLRTLRRRTTLRDGQDRVLAHVDDDEVSIIRGSRVAARFRELEVGLGDGAPAAVLTRIAERLRAAGAQPLEPVPKLARALGPPALAAWDLAVPAVGSDPRTDELVRRGLVASAARLVDHLAAVVLDEDPEGVHQARVGIRRVRSDLRTFGPLLDKATVRPLRRELGWLAGELGEVRDLDVLLARLSQDVADLDGADRLAAREVLAAFGEQRQRAFEHLRAALRTSRCANLLEETLRTVTLPPFASRKARRPARKIVPRLVRSPLRELRREAKGLGDPPDDAALHTVRIRVKRARYATELAAPLVGKRARKTARELGRLQDVLGDHNDACVALVRLRQLGDDGSTSIAWGAGLLGGLQLEHAADCRARFGSAWKRAMAKKRWRWIR